MPRADLGNLLAVATGTDENGSKPSTKAKTERPERPSNEQPQSTPVRSVPQPEAKAEPGEPKSAGSKTKVRGTASKKSDTAQDDAGYLSFERVDTRLREEQIVDLELLARRLSKQKGSGDPRITKNTLIRVAVDLLLAKKPTGGSEDSIRRSVGL